MTANNRKNTRILLFLILCIRMTLTVSAGDFLFTSVNTAQGLSDNQIRIYQCGDSLLWIKDRHKLMCIHLPQEEYIADLDSYFREREYTRTGRRPFR